MQNTFVFVLNLYFFTGNKTLYADAYPTLKQLLIEMSKLVPNPSSVEFAAGHTKVFDTWLANNPDPENPSQPRFQMI